MRKLWSMTLGVCVFVPVPPLAAAQERFTLLATNRTGTMEDELNEAGAAGYRFVATQGGDMAFGGREAVVVMELDPEGRRYRYMLLATTTATMAPEWSR